MGVKVSGIVPFLKLMTLITFGASKELKEGAFIRLTVMPIRGVIEWKEVQYDELPAAVQGNYAAPASE